LQDATLRVRATRVTLRAGDLSIVPGSEGRDPFSQYEASDEEQTLTLVYTRAP
jgi:hypothetical protein